MALKLAPAATSAQAGGCHCVLQAQALYLYLALLAAGSAPTGTLCKCVPSAKLRRCHPLSSLLFCFFFSTLPFHIFFPFSLLTPVDSSLCKDAGQVQNKSLTLSNKQTNEKENPTSLFFFFFFFFST